MQYCLQRVLVHQIIAQLLTNAACISLPRKLIMSEENSKASSHCGKEWFRYWFGSPYYDMLYRNRNAAEAENFISALTKELDLPRTASILDLACGKGRHSLLLHSIGYQVTGVDLSEESIRFAQQYQSEGLNFLVGDMRSLNLNHRFDCVMNLFTSFGYFEQIEDNLQVLQRVKEHLKPNGLFVLDYLNAGLIKSSLPQDYTVERENGVRFHIHKLLENDFVVKKIVIDNQECQMNYEERVQLLESEQLQNMLVRAGLSPIALYGNYALQKFDPLKSERMIIIASN